MSDQRPTASCDVPGVLKSAVSQPAFVAAFVVLFIAAMSLNGATQFMQLYFKKEPVPLVKPLELVPSMLGPWVQVSTDQTLDPEMLDVLGTKQYIFRDYVDQRLVSERELAALKSSTDKERASLLSKIQRERPHAILRGAVTYYTGSADTVAHIPDRCYVADGFQVDKYTSTTWSARDKNLAPLEIPVRFINFEDTTPARGLVNRNVAYFFQCNGDYVNDPLRGVRIRLQSLTERHGYYAKIELMNEMKDRDKAAEVMRDFLYYAMPEVEQCLPDWKQVKANSK